MKTFDEALQIVTDGETYERAEHSMALQDEFEADIIASKLVPGFVEMMIEMTIKQSREEDVLPTIFFNALRLGVAVGVHMERQELEPKPKGWAK